MNARVARLLLDYFRRTLGVWLALGAAHVMQVIAFWALEVERLPLLGVVIASLICFAAFESPHAVLRTLPLSRADIALFRWWASVGAPGVVLAVSTWISWLNSGDNAWPRPPLSDVALYAAVCWALLGALAVLPLPARTPERRTHAAFGFIWALLAAVGFYGIPTPAEFEPFAAGVAILGIALTGAAYVHACMGRTLRIPAWSGEKAAVARTPRESNLRGWLVVAADIAPRTAVLAVVSLIAVSVARVLYPVLSTVKPLVWLFVAAVAITASLQSRRWMSAVRSLRVLPIGDHRLALILYVLLMVPGAVACLVATAVWHVWPQLGMDIPPYMFVVFLGAPIALLPWQRQGAVPDSIRQWAPFVQQVAWPIWAGAFCSFGGPDLMPTWYLGFLLLVAGGCVIAGYLALLSGIRSPEGFGPYGALSVAS